MDSVECTKQKARAIIAVSKVPEDPLHAENTLDWLLRLKPDADEALKIAALGHDIERALETRKVKRVDFPDYDAFKAAHARNSAEILREITEACGVPQGMASEVYWLVCRHETGGDPRSDLIKHADGISYFHVNMPLYFQREGWEETKRRCIWGFGRLSVRAKKIVENIIYPDETLTKLLQEAIRESQPKD
ncbi:MAG: DUF4202 family protein [Deltaproteobacteria bacterium]|nr:DUF4202 family protein [Deltaproteobacteria bacterium]